MMTLSCLATRFRTCAVIAGLALAGHAAPTLAACDSGLTVKSVTKTYRDAARANRSVGVTVHYPTASSTSTAIVTGCGFPVVSFGHGFTIGNNAYAYLPNRLVPSGYVVVMPSTEGGLSPNHANFGKDLAFVLDAVRSDPIFAGALGTRSAIGGHSMGGGAAFLGTVGSRANALFALAPAETNPKASVAATSISIPTMVVTGTRDCVAPYAQHAGLMLAALATPDASTYDAPITGGNHCQFTTGSSTCSFGQSTCGGSATITAAQQQTLTLDSVKPFLDLVLKGR